MRASTRGAARQLALAVVAIAGLSVGACKEPKLPPVQHGISMADSAEQVLYNIRTLITNRGIQRGELVADTAYIFNDQTKFLFRVARVYFTKETGAPNGTMLADRGIYDLRSQLLEGWGHVKISTLDGKTLTAPQIKYNQVLNEVSSDSAFRLVDGERVQTGIGFKADPNLNRVQIFKNASGKARATVNLQ